jgi:hypothetical protein
MGKKKKLVKISTYARDNKMSVQWVYRLIDKGLIKEVEIDGMKFIETKVEE